ncbi:MAG: hypothetical protein OCD02_03120 [Spirochaetaceae bacterium]
MFLIAPDVDETANILENIIHGGGDLIMTAAQRLELKGEKRGIIQGISKTAKNMKADGISIKTIKKCTGLTEEEIKKL